MTPTQTPTAEQFEPVACYLCGHVEPQPMLTAQDDLTGKPGNFTFVTCKHCGFAYQNPRLKLAHIAPYYDDEYIAHRKKDNWGFMTPLFERAMTRLDNAKTAICQRYVELDSETQVLDVGCGAARFLIMLCERFKAHATGVDFKNLSALHDLRQIDFRHGLFYEQDFGTQRFDLITMWHFLEHDYDPPRSLACARELLAPNGRIVIEVPRLDSLTFRLYGDRWPGLQAPQHTVLFSKESLQRMVRDAGLEIVDYLPYGAYPAYFYVFAGLAFKFLKGRGLNLDRAIVPYFIGQALLFPLLLLERRLNVSMQTIVCRCP